VATDADLKQRIQALKQERVVAQAALDRMAVQARTRAAITPARLEAFSKLMCEKLDTADVQARKAYLQSVIAQIEVGDGRIRVFSDKTALAATAIGQNTSAPNVRGFVRGWRTRRDSNSRPLPSETALYRPARVGRVSGMLTARGVPRFCKPELYRACFADSLYVSH
jgi:hypothetical protein